MPLSKATIETIRQVITQELAPAQIADVIVAEGWDHEGERILRVDVVLKSRKERPDPARVIGLPRHLREPLENLHVELFPMISFLTPDDLAGAAA